MRNNNLWASVFLVLACLTSVYSQTTTFLPWDSEWNYYDLGNQPPSIAGNAWSDDNYNDSSWASGDAELGYGDGDEDTQIDPNTLTAYFRKDFTINNPCQYEDIKIRIWHDDGSVVYLNGVDVWRINMPSGQITYNTFASSTSGDNAVRTITLPISAFNEGLNTIAVETHQANAGSSDLSFNLTVFGPIDAQTAMCSCNGTAIVDSDGDGVCDDIDLCDNNAGPCAIDLSQYSLCYTNVVTSVPDDFSGMTYNFDSETFYAVENDKSKVFELDTDGNIIRNITLVGYGDVEGIAYLGNNDFVVVEERLRRIVFINIPPGGSDISRSYPGFNGYIEVTGHGSGSNDGLEGITYSPVDDLLYIAKEKTDMAIFAIQNPASKKGTTINPNQPFDLVNKANSYPGSGGFTDIAGLSFTDKGTLLLLSEEGNSLVEVDPFNGNLISSMSMSDANTANVEGVTYISPGELVFASEPNEFYRYTTHGGSCDDGDSCTINDTWNGCDCSGTLMDSDGDGICNSQDACPNLDNSLIGGSCNDGNSCTINDVWTSACNCAGTPTSDSDNDGVCNADDACPGKNDNLVGAACNDGDPCTTNDKYNNNCKCVGTPGQDADNDGVCDTNDACPNFDDNLIGNSCNDGDACTRNDVWTSSCNCIGTPLQDSDNDGVCDINDGCPNDAAKTSSGLCGCGNPDADSNNNGICDDDEQVSSNCPVSTFVAGFPAANTTFTTKRFITTNASHDKIGTSIEFSAGELVTLLKGFEVKKGAIFHGYIKGCN